MTSGVVVQVSLLVDGPNVLAGRSLFPECTSPSRLAAEGPDDQTADRKVQQRRSPQVPGERSPGVQGQRGHRSIHRREERSVWFITSLLHQTWEYWLGECLSSRETRKKRHLLMFFYSQLNVYIGIETLMSRPLLIFSWSSLSDLSGLLELLVSFHQYSCAWNTPPLTMLAALSHDCIVNEWSLLSAPGACVHVTRVFSGCAYE